MDRETALSLIQVWHNLRLSQALQAAAIMHVAALIGLLCALSSLMGDALQQHGWMHSNGRLDHSTGCWCHNPEQLCTRPQRCQQSAHQSLVLRHLHGTTASDVSSSHSLFAQACVMHKPRQTYTAHGSADTCYMLSVPH